MDDFLFVEAPEAEILIVDDNLVNIKVTEGLLKLCKIKPDIAQSGMEAIEKIKQKHYDLVLMDHLMPEMDGLETTAVLRKDGYGENELVIIALSANVAADAKEMFLNCGMQDFLAKPIDKMLFNELLKKWLPKEKTIDPHSAMDKRRAVLEGIRKIEALEFDAGLEKANGDEGAHMHSIRVLTKNAPPIASILSSCDNLKRIESLTRGAHVLLENAGAAKMSKRAQEINQAASRGDMDLCKERLPDFLADLNMLCSEISEMIKADWPYPSVSFRGAQRGM